MKASAKIAFVIVILLTIAIFVLESGLLYVEPILDRRQDTTQYTPTQNVVIHATTFNGNIEIQPTTDSKINVTYIIKTPQGHLYDVKINNNQTKDENQTTTITTSAQNQVDPANAQYTADLILLLPQTSQYNLTLVTSNGNIIKPRLNDARVAASTMNGDITITDGDNCANIDATCMNGNIKITLAKDTLFQVVASVGNGNIDHQGIPMNSTIQSATRLKGATSAGNGTLNMALMTTNGNIKLEYYTP